MSTQRAPIDQAKERARARMTAKLCEVSRDVRGALQETDTHAAKELRRCMSVLRGIVAELEGAHGEQAP